MTVTAAISERWTLDGLELNEPATGIGMLSASCPPPARQPTWLESPDADGALLLEDPRATTREHVYRCQIDPQADMNTALARVALIADKLRECSRTPTGLPLVWTPATATVQATFTALLGEIVEIPTEVQGDQAGWFFNAPQFTIKLVCAPDGDLAPLANITDAFGTNSIADYTFDAGAAGNVNITGGVMDAAANLTTENRMLHTASPWPLYDTQATVKHTLGTTVTSYKTGVILKRIDASNYVEVYVDDNGTNSRLRVDRVIAGSRTNLVSTNLGARLSVSTGYWVRGRLEGNVVTAEHWTSAPTVTGAPTLTNTATLAGGDATALGSGIAGRAGLVWTPQQTAAALDDLAVEPNVYRGIDRLVQAVIYGVPGDAVANGRLILTDAQGQNRRWAEWGAEQPASQQFSSLIIDSDQLVTSGYSGAQATLTGAYDPNASGNNVVQVNVPAGFTVPLCALPSGIALDGSYRVRARVNGTGASLRIAWQDDDDPITANAWVESIITGFAVLELGLITVNGTLNGRVDVLAGTADATASLDCLELIPVSAGWGKARGEAVESPGALVAFDKFTGTTAGGALNARVAPLGGTWATSGAATDFIFGDPTAFTLDLDEHISRNAAGTRYAILGSTNYTDVAVQVGMGQNATDAITRWTDASNYVYGRIDNSATLSISKVVAGVTTVLASFSGMTVLTRKLLLTVLASGQATLTAYDTNGLPLKTVIATDAALATGGTLATGKPGLADVHAFGGGLYDTFIVTVPPTTTAPTAIYTGRQLEITHESALRQNAAATSQGGPGTYRGKFFALPPAGDDDLATRVVAHAARNDLDVAADDTLGDKLQMQVLYTPRIRTVPR